MSLLLTMLPKFQDDLQFASLPLVLKISGFGSVNNEVMVLLGVFFVALTCASVRLPLFLLFCCVFFVRLPYLVFVEARASKMS